jgi:ABC-type sugar transport system ATPase subunit
MLGQSIVLDMPPKQPPAADAPVRLAVKGLSRGTAVEGIDLEVRSGEIVGIAGLVGSGRTEFARLVFGADRATAGTVEIDGTPLSQGSPREAIEAGVGFVPEDRAEEGLLLDLSQRINVSLPHLDSFSRLGWPSPRREAREVREMLDTLQVRPIDLDGAVGNLSGGNQQKILFGKWLVREPRVLILDEPTRGVDVGAKWAIYDLIASLAARGMAVLLISSETEELVGLAHRVLVMRRGRLVGSFESEAISVDPIMHTALGVDLSQEGNQNT